MIFKQVFIASDHAGIELKKSLMAWCEALHLPCKDLGTEASSGSVDYPDYAQAVAQKVLATPDSAGILICGSGVGMSIAANRFPGIRAALCLDKGKTADLARRHNNANILCLGARLISESAAKESLKVFFQTSFEKGRHARRLKKVENKDSIRNPNQLSLT